MKTDNRNLKAVEDAARYRARLDWKAEACFKNPYEKGTLESAAYLAEAHKIHFEMDESL